MKMDDSTFKKVRPLEYPYFYISKLTDKMAFLISSIPKGDIAITTSKEGHLMTLVSVTKDPVHLKLFIEMYNPTLCLSETDHVRLESIIDYIREVTKDVE